MRWQHLICTLDDWHMCVPDFAYVHMCVNYASVQGKMGYHLLSALEAASLSDPLHALSRNDTQQGDLQVLHYRRGSPDAARF